jgi:hypothetical protein
VRLERPRIFCGKTCTTSSGGFPIASPATLPEFLDAWGLAHFDWAERGDLFTSAEAARALRSLYDALAPLFRAPGVSCLKTANSLIY